MKSRRRFHKESLPDDSLSFQSMDLAGPRVKRLALAVMIRFLLIRSTCGGRAFVQNPGRWRMTHDLARSVERKNGY